MSKKIMTCLVPFVGMFVVFCVFVSGLVIIGDPFRYVNEASTINAQKAYDAAHPSPTPLPDCVKQISPDHQYMIVFGLAGANCWNNRLSVIRISDGYVVLIEECPSPGSKTFCIENAYFGSNNDIYITIETLDDVLHGDGINDSTLLIFDINGHRK